MGTQTSKAAKLLQGMGHNADEVATFLRQKGIQGTRNTARFLNPIVRYLQTEVNAESLDLMQENTLTITNAGGRKEKTAIPQVVRDFLIASNRGAYPDLVLPKDKL